MGMFGQGPRPALPSLLLAFGGVFLAGAGLWAVLSTPPVVYECKVSTELLYPPTSMANPSNDLAPVAKRPVAMLFGDSLTQYSFDPNGGWGAALAHHFQRKVS